jgi:hypothetical protein
MGFAATRQQAENLCCDPNGTYPGWAALATPNWSFTDASLVDELRRLSTKLAAQFQ